MHLPNAASDELVPGFGHCPPYHLVIRFFLVSRNRFSVKKQLSQLINVVQSGEGVVGDLAFTLETVDVTAGKRQEDVVQIFRSVLFQLVDF